MNITVYSKDNCIWCDRAKNLLNSVNFEFDEIDLSNDEERQEFYKEAKKSQLIVSTSEMRPYGCFILTKGVIKPDGSVWVLDK